MKVNTSRRIISLFLTFLMICTCIPVIPYASAATEYTYGDYTYSLVGSDAVIESFPESFSGKVDIPTSLNKHTVVEIGSYAFYGCTMITEVTIPSTVKKISTSAFSFCVSLKKVSIPLSVKEIGNNAFKNSNNLKDVYYEGNSSDWAKISKGSGNENLNSEILHFNSPNIYSLGEETYSFDNFGDDDSSGGHCFGMSITSAGYYLGKLDSTKIGAKNGNIFNLSFNDTVSDPICYYQGIQGSKSKAAIVAGGSSYLSDKSNINSDWTSVVKYVKNHNYDDKGNLQIGIRVDGEGGHAINFLHYAVVDGQERIYAYDNNFPETETYFYKDSTGVHQAPESTFDFNSLSCIALRNVPTYLENVGNYFDSNQYTEGYIGHLFFAEKGMIAIEGAEEYLIETDVARKDYVVFEVSETEEYVAITPLVDGATFTYLGDEYRFEKADGETTGVFVFSDSVEDNTGSMTIEKKDHVDKNNDGKCDNCKKILDPVKACKCECHKSKQSFMWKLQMFFWKLFKVKSHKTCACGKKHY